MKVNHILLLRSYSSLSLGGNQTSPDIQQSEYEYVGYFFGSMGHLDMEDIIHGPYTSRKTLTSA